MRYFLFSYTYNNGNGNYWLMSETFPSRSYLRNIFSEKSNQPVDNIVISGWYEFNNKQDYDDFLS